MLERQQVPRAAPSSSPSSRLLLLDDLHPHLQHLDQALSSCRADTNRSSSCRRRRTSTSSSRRPCGLAPPIATPDSVAARRHEHGITLQQRKTLAHPRLSDCCWRRTAKSPRPARRGSALPSRGRDRGDATRDRTTRSIHTRSPHGDEEGEAGPTAGSVRERAVGGHRCSASCVRWLRMPGPPCTALESLSSMLERVDARRRVARCCALEAQARRPLVGRRRADGPRLTDGEAGLLDLGDKPRRNRSRAGPRFGQTRSPLAA